MVVLPELAGSWPPGLRAAPTAAGLRRMLGMFVVGMGTCKLRKEKTHHTRSLEQFLQMRVPHCSPGPAPCVFGLPSGARLLPFPVLLQAQQCCSFMGLHGGGNIFISTAGDPGGLYIWEDTNLWSKYFILVLSSKRDFHFPLSICEVLLGHFRVLHIWDLKRHFLFCR